MNSDQYYFTPFAPPLTPECFEYVPVETEYEEDFNRQIPLGRGYDGDFNLQVPITQSGISGLYYGIAHPVDILSTYNPIIYTTENQPNQIQQTIVQNKKSTNDDCPCFCNIL